MRKLTLVQVRESLLAGKDLYESFGLIFEADSHSKAVDYVIDKVLASTADELMDLIKRYDDLCFDAKSSYEWHRDIVVDVLMLCWFELVKMGF